MTGLELRARGQVVDRPGRVGPGRLLACGYALFVVAAGGRSAVELAEAVTGPRCLSALAAAIYATGLVLVLAAERGRARTAAIACASLELVSVVMIGTVSVLRPGTLVDTVWSRFGAGYGFVPLLLPLGMLAWLVTRGVGEAIGSQA